MNKTKKAFTIIEVVLVLAIAGLIFLMVFIALPALQRSQRNTRRRQDMARILSAVNDFQANNSGKSPVSIASDGKTADKRGDFVERYVDQSCKLLDENGGRIGGTSFSNSYGYECSGNQFKDPDGAVYTVAYSSPGYFAHYSAEGSLWKVWGHSEGFRENHTIGLVGSAKCSGNEAEPVVKVDGEANIAVIYVLEGGAVYCGDNQ